MRPTPFSDEMDAENYAARVRLIRRLRQISWCLALVAFAGGLFVGLNINAQAGATLWIAAAALALAPFLSHRDNLH